MKLWPRSLKGQLMLTVALALLLAQTIHAVLLYRVLVQQSEAAMIHNAAFRMLRATQENQAFHPTSDQQRRFGNRGFSLERTLKLPMRPGEHRNRRAEMELQRILSDQDVAVQKIFVVARKVQNDPASMVFFARQAAALGVHRMEVPDRVLLAGAFIPKDGRWLVVRVFFPSGERALVMALIGQTVLIYGVLVAAIAFILRRIVDPLADLTARSQSFTGTPVPGGQLVPEGPDDVRDLIVAHNAMESRISALIDEKDVMLGAIGHDLKTPLAALRVRIESVEDDRERTKMAATIDDIARTLDDILSLARAGRPSDPLENSELSALLAAIAEEYEDLGSPVTLEDTSRMALPVRATWLRRALRNLIDNALRYGKHARVSLRNEGGVAVFRVDDDGPGIPDVDIGRMVEPFTRGDPSRNSETGGAGLGLALARAIAEQHGGKLELANRMAADGTVEGLRAELRLPLI